MESSGWSSPLVVALIGATVTALGVIFSNIILTRGTLAQQRMEHESRLVLEVVRTSDLERSRENLRFLLAAGLLRDENGRLASSVADSSLSLTVGEPTAPTYRPLDIEVEGIYYQIMEKAGIRWSSSELRGVPRMGQPALWNGRSLTYDTNWFFTWLITGDTVSIVLSLAPQMAHRALEHLGVTTGLPTGDEQVEAYAWAGWIAHQMGIAEAELSQFFARGPYSQRSGSGEELEGAALRGWALSAGGRPISEVVTR